VLSNIQSELDSLKQRVVELLAENAKIKVENAKVKAENAKLRQAMKENETRFDLATANDQSHVISENLENLEETVTNLSRSDYVYTNTSKVSGLEQNDETDVVDTSQIIVQGLIQELIQNQCEVTCQTDSISSDDKINKSCIQDMENLISDFAEKDGVGIAKIKQITYSASSISGLTNAQIKNILDHSLTSGPSALEAQARRQGSE
ncbi:19752_t:CDS:2, partial [Funneliformis geosporum]